jgi:hypothetical protein
MNTRALRGSILIVLMGLSVAFTIRADAQQQPTAIPAAPNGLKYYVNGSLVALEWSVNSNDNTSFIIEAGGTPGTTFFSFSTLALANPGFLTQMIPNFSASAPSGNYFVRVHAANAEGRSVASNEILVPITGGCQVPGPPTEFNAIVRGNFGMLQWYPGQGGVQSFYVLEARQAPAGPIIAAFQTTTNFFNVNGIPNGTFYVTIRAVNACGSSAPSAQITVVAPSNTPAQRPNPVNGNRLPLPYVADIVADVAARNPSLFINGSCPNPNVRYITNQFLNLVVDTLRTYDTRFGYNSKPTRGPAENGGQPVVAAGDEIAYHYGADAPEGSANTYAIDIIFSHCGSPEITWRNFTGMEFARWTGAGRF